MEARCWHGGSLLANSQLGWTGRLTGREWAPTAYGTTVAVKTRKHRADCSWDLGGVKEAAARYETARSPNRKHGSGCARVPEWCLFGRRRLEAGGYCEQPHPSTCTDLGIFDATAFRTASIAPMSGELLPSRGLRLLLHVFRGQSALTDCLNAFQMPQPAGRFMPRPSSSTRHWYTAPLCVLHT